MQNTAWASYSTFNDALIHTNLAGLYHGGPLSPFVSAPQPHQSSLTHTLTITCTCACCCDGVYGAQDLKISHAHSLILSHVHISLFSSRSYSHLSSISISLIVSVGTISVYVSMYFHCCSKPGHCVLCVLCSRILYSWTVTDVTCCLTGLLPH